MIKVCIVEDESLVRRGLIMTTPWEKYGWEVVGQASTGQEGLELCQILKPDVVITDIRMPGIDGIEMIERLKESIDADYIIISGYGEFRYAQQAVRLGVKDYLLKPIDDTELDQVLKKVTDGVRQRKQMQKLVQQIDQLPDSRVMLFKEYFLNNTLDTKENYVREAVSYIQEHYSEDICIKEVASRLTISESYLSRLFKQETNYTFLEYLTYYRIKKSMHLLKEKRIKVFEVSGMVGYNDVHYFSMIFKRLVGVTPREFKDGVKDKLDGGLS